MDYSEHNPDFQREDGKQNSTFEQFLDQYEYKQPEVGQFLKGQILTVDQDVVIVDVGLKRDVVVPRTDFDLVVDRFQEVVTEGGNVPIMITQASPQGGRLLASIQKGLEWEDWNRVEMYLAKGKPFEVKVTGRNRGGLKIAFGNLSGFIPKSHLTFPTRRLFQSEESPHALAGMLLRVKVIQVDRANQNLVLSEREAYQRERKQRLTSLQPGQVIRGTVTRVLDYGAFVDLSGVEGMIHISELDWGWVSHPSKIVTEGDEVDVLIMEIDLERGRLRLSRKRLLSKPTGKE